MANYVHTEFSFIVIKMADPVVYFKYMYPFLLHGSHKLMVAFLQG